MDTPHKAHPWIEERRSNNPKLASHQPKGFAATLATKFGSMTTFYLLAIWIFVWVILSSLEFSVFKNDPYPFNFLLFLSNIVQLLSLPLLAYGQQSLSRRSDKLAAQTYQDAEAILALENELHRLIEINTKLTAEIHAQLIKIDKSK